MTKSLGIECGIIRLMGTLYIVSTPIGNLDDITIRAIKTLFSVDYIACEDTRKTGLLIQNYELRIKNRDLCIKDLRLSKNPKLISYYDETEEQKSPEIVSLLEQGYDVALVSDAGTPLLSDPGFKLVSIAIKRRIRIVPIPGPSAMITALVASGLPTHGFRFIGYLPQKLSKRIALLKSILNDSRPRGYQYTVILFEAPQRIKDTLEDIKSVFGDIDVVLARELTKIHEELIRAKIVELLRKNFKAKGEFVILF